MEDNSRGTLVRPATLDEACVKHGRFMSRYLRAGALAPGKRVLDVACGMGYGSALLARTAQSVLGLDIDEEMIALARQTYRAENLRFDLHDLHQPLPCGPYDLITSFETLEHVRDASLCVANLAGGLAEGGTLMVSVPNGTKEAHGGRDKPYHRVHFTPEEFERLLDPRFGQVELLSQLYRKDLRHYLRKLLGRASHHASNYVFVPGLLGQAKTWMAVCRKDR